MLVIMLEALSETLDLLSASSSSTIMSTSIVNMAEQRAWHGC
jgi:hypothetical protein